MKTPELPQSEHSILLRSILADQRETAAQLASLTAVLKLSLGDGRQLAAEYGTDWVAGDPSVPARLRVLAQLPGGGWVAEAEYEAGAGMEDVAIADSASVVTVCGSFLLRRYAQGPDYTTYPAGSTFQLTHHERHGWKAQDLCRSIIIFIPEPATP